MKKTVSVLLAIVTAFSLLAGCGDMGKVTPEKQTAITGIELKLPENAENVSYSILVDESYVRSPQIEFTYNGADYIYRAEKTDKAEPYDFSETHITNVENTVIKLDGYEYSLLSGEGGVLIMWISGDTAYNVCSPTALYDSASALVCELHALIHENGEYNRDAELIAAEMAIGIWKQDNEDNYIRIRKNLTYTIYGKNATKSKVLFWKVSENGDDTVELLSSNGSVNMTLKLGGDLKDPTLTSAEGTVYLPTDSAMNGTYYCYLDSSLLSDGKLSLMEIEEQWVSKDAANNIEVGDLLNISADGSFDVKVESIEERKSKRIVLNGEYQLVYDSSADAWEFLGTGLCIEELAGKCELKKSTKLSDRLCDKRHKDVGECLAASHYILANVTVRNGAATRIVVDGVF